MNLNQSVCTDFVWVEEVTGDISKRNNQILRIDEPLSWEVDQERYRSVYVSDERLSTYWESHKGSDSPSGIKGFSGPCTLFEIPFDIDRETNGEADWDLAFRDARQFLHSIDATYDIDLSMVQCSLTGGRGVHIRLPTGFFGGFEPSERVPEVVKTITSTLAAEGGIEIDLGIYDRNRVLRVPNSRHQLGRYCVPVYTDDLLHRNTDTLTAFMNAPRPEVTWIGEVAPVPLLVDLKRECEGRILTGKTRAGPFSAAPKERAAEVVAFLKEHGIGYRSNGDDFVLRCPSGNHEDHEPSFRINRNNGIYHCFGCGVKGNWEQCKQLLRNDLPTLPSTNPVPELTDVKNAFRRWLYLEDDTFIEVGLAAAIANNFPGDPLWLFLVGPPGSCKTEFLRSLTSTRTYQLSSLTPNSLISGLKTPGDKDPSLLPKLNNKVLIIKDFTAILSARHEVRCEIFGQLRDIYDGYCEKSFGSGVGTRSYRCHLGILAGVTPEIERYSSVEQALGERFLKFRVNFSDPDEAVKRARQNAGEQGRMREELNTIVGQFLERDWECNPNAVACEDAMAEKIVKLASLVALLRTGVPKNRNGELEYLPVPEVGTRLSVQLTKLGSALSLIRGKSVLGEEEYRILVRIGRESLPSLRWKLVCGLMSLHRSGTEWHRTKDIGEKSNLSTDTANVQLHDLYSIGAVERNGEGRFTWRPSQRLVDLFDITEMIGDLVTI